MSNTRKYVVAAAHREGGEGLEFFQGSADNRSAWQAARLLAREGGVVQLVSAEADGDATRELDAGTYTIQNVRLADRPARRRAELTAKALLDECESRGVTVSQKMRAVFDELCPHGAG
jgi:hypothetical protein